MAVLGLLLLTLAGVGSLLYMQHLASLTAYYGSATIESRESDGQGEVALLQDKKNNCGPVALKMILDHFRIHVDISLLEQDIQIARGGSSMSELKRVAESKGLRAQGWKYNLDDLLQSPLPAILLVHGNHFIVVDSVLEDGRLIVRDPAIGKKKLKSELLLSIWKGETLSFSVKNEQSAFQDHKGKGL